ncbi:hypothetical protein TCAL_00254 [Tigriopus californicus]|uniref:Major facilitator superfamily (MFS) profile domain-containing protein n=1 Tax=Tigriopus californicus TaxID=6832 RepID=A0A553P396_TIGCA|nr:lysosomal proton-coupled steroid conjugate and bile acid symporter SLC46A3-like [Tigriopus californicus]TRY72153.1 hypothetical protein TCAL_00254 [Tigriopus californicus]|eukprot:TCALIF_00254-PA protein Name:"Similar to SLC46A3 Solute carrier family 46 member 3 (Gallus gallus)" AED:0.09 eAED:0.09 QI:0/0/0/1/1/1/2/0/538
MPISKESLDSKPSSCCGKLKSAWSLITVEPAVLLLTISYGLYMIVSSELYITKVCKVNLALGDEICDNIQDHNEEQVLVQRYVSKLNIYNRVLQAVPSFIFAVVAGPWSDVYGRRTFLILSISGFVFNNAVFMLNIYFFYELKAEWLLLECLQDCTGGTILFYLTVYAYIADITDPSTRTKRMAFLSGLWPIGSNIGKALGGLIKNQLGFMYNFAIGMLVALVAMLYIVLFVKETVKPNTLEEYKTSNDPKQVNRPKERSQSLGARISFLFSLENVKNGFSALTRPRKHNMRAYIILLLFVFQFMMFNFVADYTNRYLFLRRSLGLNLEDYTRYSIATGVIGIISQCFLVPFLSEKMKIRDATISFYDMFASAINCLIMAFATEEWMLYVGAVINCLDSSSYSVVRSMVTKIAEPHETGSLLAVFGSFQSIMPMIATPVFGMLYRSTVANFPQLYLLIVAGFFLLNSVCLLFVRHGLKKLNKKMAQDDGVIGEEILEMVPTPLKARPKSWYPERPHSQAEKDSVILTKIMSQSMDTLT